MRPNFLFLLAASNANLKPGGFLKWKMRLTKDVRLLLPLIEVMKIVRLTSLPLDMPHPSSPKPRLKYGRRHGRLSLSLPNLTLSQSIFSSVLLLAHFPHLLPLLTSSSVLLPESQHRSTPATWDPTFLFPSQKTLRSRAKGYLSEHQRITSNKESHSSFCFLFCSAEFLTAATDLYSSNLTGPYTVVYPLLKHLLRTGMDFLFDIFSLSWSLHFFPSIWETTSLIPIHKIGKPLNSLSSFRPTSVTSCISKLFERMILSRLLFFLESNTIFSPWQAGFRPAPSIIDQIFYLSQSISNGFNKPKRGSRTNLATIDFSKAFDSVWHPTLF